MKNFKKLLLMTILCGLTAPIIKAGGKKRKSAPSESEGEQPAKRQKESPAEKIDKHGNTTLILVSGCGQADKVWKKNCINHLKFRLNGGSEKDYALSPLLCENMPNNVITAQDLLAQGIDVNHANQRGETALMWACASGQYEIVKILIDKLANVNHADAQGNTPLIWATCERNIDIIKDLLVAGALPETANKTDETALFWANKIGNEEIINLLNAALSAQILGTYLQENQLKCPGWPGEEPVQEALQAPKGTASIEAPQQSTEPQAQGICTIS